MLFSESEQKHPHHMSLLENVGVNPTKVLDSCLPKSTSCDARRNAARSLSLLPGYERGKNMHLYVLRVVCCPINIIDTLAKKLEKNEFYSGRMDSLITCDPVAADFAPGKSGTEYTLVVARSVEEAWN